MQHCSLSPLPLRLSLARSLACSNTLAHAHRGSILPRRVQRQRASVMVPRTASSSSAVVPILIVYTQINIYIHIYINIDTIYIYIHKYIYIYICMCVYVYIYMCMYISTFNSYHLHPILISCALFFLILGQPSAEQAAFARAMSSVLQ